MGHFRPASHNVPDGTSGGCYTRLLQKTLQFDSSEQGTASRRITTMVRKNGALWGAGG
jgi:hypothetical protein